MTERDRFEVVDGGRADDDPLSQDDLDALDALTAILAGPEGDDDPEVAARARAVASNIMNLPGDTSPGLRPVDGPPAG